MDGERFDAIIKAFARRGSRRSVLHVLASVATGGMIGRTVTNGAEAATRRPPGSICREDANCVEGSTCEKNARGRLVCTCGAAMKSCGDRCVPLSGCCTAAECLDDSNPCTDTVCQNGACAYPARVGAVCDDGSSCTDDDRCQADGACRGTPKVCPTGQACFLGACQDCGDNGEPCCAGNACSGDLECDIYNQPGICSPCGGEQETCCGGPDGTCDPGTACFPSIRCVTCGSDGQLCCDPLGEAPTSCDDGVVCRQGTCATCGGNGQPCCAGNLCTGDLQCDIYNEPGICTPCGGSGETCCGGPGGTCDAGTACFPSGRCITCGADGQQCCDPLGGAADSCDDGVVCRQGMCATCGGTGQPCCAGNVCSGDLQCDTINQPGICDPCGGNGETCCGGVGGTCDPGTACFPSIRCVTCGADGQQCCDPLGGAADSCDDGVVCRQGMCATCGGSGQPCCAENACSSDLQCDVYNEAAICAPCGGNGETCCGGPGGTCDPGNACFPSIRCVTCGAPGQTCCFENPNVGTCDPGATCVGGTCQ